MNRKQRNKATLLKKHFRERERSLLKSLQAAYRLSEKTTVGANLQALGFQRTMVRVAMAYGEVTSRNAKGEPNGFCLKLPPLPEKENRRWKVYGETDPNGTSRVGVALRDEPEDGMSEAEIEEIKEKKQEGR